MDCITHSSSCPTDNDLCSFTRSWLSRGWTRCDSNGLFPHFYSRDMTTQRDAGFDFLPTTGEEGREEKKCFPFSITLPSIYNIGTTHTPTFKNLFWFFLINNIDFPLSNGFIPSTYLPFCTFMTRKILGS